MSDNQSPKIQPIMVEDGVTYATSEALPPSLRGDGATRKTHLDNHGTPREPITFTVDFRGGGSTEMKAYGMDFSDGAFLLLDQNGVRIAGFPKESVLAVYPKADNDEVAEGTESSRVTGYYATVMTDTKGHLFQYGRDEQPKVTVNADLINWGKNKPATEREVQALEKRFAALLKTLPAESRIEDFIVKSEGLHIGDGQEMDLIKAYANHIDYWFARASTPAQLAREKDIRRWERVPEAAALRKGDILILNPLLNGGYGRAVILVDEQKDGIRMSDPDIDNFTAVNGRVVRAMTQNPGPAAVRSVDIHDLHSVLRYTG